MVSLWVALCGLEVAPDFHRLLHRDAQNPGHTCLVTQFQHHQVLPGFAVAFAPAPPDVAPTFASSATSAFLPAYDYRLTPSRGPPSV